MVNFIFCKRPFPTNNSRANLRGILVYMCVYPQLHISLCMCVWDHTCAEVEERCLRPTQMPVGRLRPPDVWDFCGVFVCLHFKFINLRLWGFLCTVGPYKTNVTYVIIFFFLLSSIYFSKLTIACFSDLLTPIIQWRYTNHTMTMLTLLCQLL